MKHFIIALKQNDSSMRIANECVVQAKKFNLDVEYFDGINGYDADVFFQSEGIIPWNKKKKMNRPGVKGCAASHYCLWKKCVDLNETFLILEHDAFMIRSLPENIEDCFDEICKLDKENPFISTYDENVNRHSESDIVKIIDYQTNWGYKKNFAPYGGYFLGAWAYLIKPAAALKLVECFYQTGWIPADKQLGEKVLKLQTTNQTIFRIHPEYNYENIHEKSLTRNEL